MKKILILAGVVLAFFIVSCSSSKSQNDSDLIPDEDIDSDDIETVDDDPDTQNSEIVDDSDKIPDLDDSNSDETSYCEEDEEEFDDEDVITSYTRCYDEIPDEPYEGFFADPNLEYWVKRSLNKDEDYELTEEDLKKVKNVQMYSKDIRGIEKLVNLKYLRISGGNVYDFSPLLKLENLKEMRIDGENMDCLDASFSLLINLETLEIDGTKLNDVSPVEQLENLVYLRVAGSRVEFLPKNIGNLHKLELLAFTHDNLRNIDEIKSLTNLKRLFFHYNYIEDLSPIKCLLNLTSFGAHGNRIKDILPVTNLVNLTWLGLDNNQIEEIPKEITNLKKLQTLELDYNNISNLPDLKELDSLNEMALSDNELNDEDLMKLDGLEHVRILYLALNKKITKVPIMKNLKFLQELYLNYNSITDLSGFADNESFPALKNLDVGSNKIENVEAFRNRKGLSILRVDKNCIKDFSPLEELQERGTYVGGMNEQLESCEDTDE